MVPRGKCGRSRWRPYDAAVTQARSARGRGRGSHAGGAGRAAGIYSRCSDAAKACRPYASSRRPRKLVERGLAGVLRRTGGRRRVRRRTAARTGRVRAFACYVAEWLNRNPVCSPPDRCLRCSEAEQGRDLLLPFGTETTGHAWLHSHCWSAWSAATEAEAAATIEAMGIATPTGFPNDFDKNGGA